MKKFFPITAAMTLLLSLTACGTAGDFSAASLENTSAVSEIGTTSTRRRAAWSGVPHRGGRASQKRSLVTSWKKGWMR